MSVSASDIVDSVVLVGSQFNEPMRQRSLSSQGIERIGVALVMRHPQRHSPVTTNLKTDRETKRKAIAAVIAYVEVPGCTIEDVQEQNLGFDLRSLHKTTPLDTPETASGLFFMNITIDMRKPLEYFFLGSTEPQIYLLPARHAERPLAGLFFGVSHAR